MDYYLIGVKEGIIHKNLELAQFEAPQRAAVRVFSRMFPARGVKLEKIFVRGFVYGYNNAGDLTPYLQSGKLTAYMGGQNVRL